MSAGPPAGQAPRRAAARAALAAGPRGHRWLARAHQRRAGLASTPIPQLGPLRDSTRTGRAGTPPEQARPGTPSPPPALAPSLPLTLCGSFSLTRAHNTEPRARARARPHKLPRARSLVQALAPARAPARLPRPAGATPARSRPSVAAAAAPPPARAHARAAQQGGERKRARQPPPSPPSHAPPGRGKEGGGGRGAHGRATCGPPRRPPRPSGRGFFFARFSPHFGAEMHRQSVFFTAERRRAVLNARRRPPGQLSRIARSN